MEEWNENMIHISLSVLAGSLALVPLLRVGSRLRYLAMYPFILGEGDLHRLRSKLRRERTEEATHKGAVIFIHMGVSSGIRWVLQWM